MHTSIYALKIGYVIQKLLRILIHAKTMKTPEGSFCLLFVSVSWD